MFWIQQLIRAVPYFFVCLAKVLCFCVFVFLVVFQDGHVFFFCEFVSMVLKCVLLFCFVLFALVWIGGLFSLFGDVIMCKKCDRRAVCSASCVAFFDAIAFLFYMFLWLKNVQRV